MNMSLNLNTATPSKPFCFSKKSRSGTKAVDLNINSYIQATKLRIAFTTGSRATECFHNRKNMSILTSVSISRSAVA